MLGWAAMETSELVASINDDQHCSHCCAVFRPHILGKFAELVVAVDCSKDGGR